MEKKYARNDRNPTAHEFIELPHQKTELADPLRVGPFART